MALYEMVYPAFSISLRACHLSCFYYKTHSSNKPTGLQLISSFIDTPGRYVGFKVETYSHLVTYILSHQ